MKIKNVITETSKQIPGMQSLEDDKSTKYALRQTRLTLKQINKLRKMNDIREYEKEAKLKSIQTQYGQPAGEMGGEDLGF